MWVNKFAQGMSKDSESVGDIVDNNFTTKKYKYYLFKMFESCLSFNKVLFSLLGELDHVPEVAFYMVGNIEEVLQKADRLADEKKWSFNIN